VGIDHKDVIDPLGGWTFAYLYGIIHFISKRPLRSNYLCQAGEFAYSLFQSGFTCEAFAPGVTGQVGIEMLMCLVSETSQPEQVLRTAATIDTNV